MTNRRHQKAMRRAISYTLALREIGLTTRECASWMYGYGVPLDVARRVLLGPETRKGY